MTDGNLFPVLAGSPALQLKNMAQLTHVCSFPGLKPQTQARTFLRRL